jgi:uncharacterized cupredoxin-like copper-binding protein
MDTSSNGNGNAKTNVLTYVALVVGIIAVLLSGYTLTGMGGAADAAEAADVPEIRIIEIELGDMYVKPDTIEINVGEQVQLHVKNVGAMGHDLKLNGTVGTIELANGQEETITIGPLSANTLAWCTLPGHRESGMEFKINVIGAAHTSDYDTVSAPPAADDSAKVDGSAMPSAAWVARDPLWQRPINQASDRALDGLAQALTDWAVQPTGTEGYKKAEVTVGVVSTQALSQKTMESTQNGLYFIGEVVDITGWLGGYNFQWAWSSAHACATALGAALKPL